MRRQLAKERYDGPILRHRYHRQRRGLLAIMRAPARMAITACFILVPPPRRVLRSYKVIPLGATTPSSAHRLDRARRRSSRTDTGRGRRVSLTNCPQRRRRRLHCPASLRPRGGLGAAPSQSRTALHDAAVSEDRGGRQVARAIAREERHDARDFLRACHAAQWNGRVRVSSAAPDRSWWTG